MNDEIREWTRDRRVGAARHAAHLWHAANHHNGVRSLHLGPIFDRDGMKDELGVESGVAVQIVKLVG